MLSMRPPRWTCSLPTVMPNTPLQNRQIFDSISVCSRSLPWEIETRACEANIKSSHPLVDLLRLGGLSHCQSQCVSEWALRSPTRQGLTGQQKQHKVRNQKQFFVCYVLCFSFCFSFVLTCFSLFILVFVCLSLVFLVFFFCISLFIYVFFEKKSFSFAFL